jgi:hypothetical protein
VTANSIYASDELSCQVDPLFELGLDRSSLDGLRNIIEEIGASEGDEISNGLGGAETGPNCPQRVERGPPSRYQAYDFAP